MSGKPNFTIDDAFEPDDDDIVRTYGSTTESTPLKPRQDMTAPDSVAVRVEEPKDRNNRSGCGKPLRLKLPEDNLSKDSDSLIQCDPNCHKYDARDGWWTHPKVRENWKVMLAAFGLLLTGLGVQGLVFFIAGAICFIPGAYHVVYVYCAVKGCRGYDFYNLPLFN
ncbi:uncharacterized protein LOC144121253 isoform X2 [Amblyomma americanum]